MQLIKQLGLIISLLIFLAQPSWGASVAGHVILTKGEVSAIDANGTTRALKRRSQIFNGDTIKTGPTASIQVRFIDKALMTIKANSEMNIERYLLTQKENEPQKEQAIMQLVKGGFRTITGTIGKGDKSAYKVKTPAASIGIRGTNYEVQQESDGSFVMGVYNGGIRVENESGIIELGEGADFNFTRVRPQSAPKGLLVPPPTLAENEATQQNQEESDEIASEDKSNEDSTDGTIEETEEEEPQSLASFDDTTLNNENNSNINNAIDTKLTDTIETTVVNSGLGTFDFKDPYKGIDASNINNPFDESIITDEQYALAKSGRLGFVAVPVNFDFGSEGTPTLPLEEASLVSPEYSSYTSFDFSNDNTTFTLSYEVYNATTQETDEYELSFVIDTENVMDGDVLTSITNALEDPAFEYRKNNETIIGVPPSDINITFDSGNYKYEFLPDVGDDNFVLSMELHFDEDPAKAAATEALQQELGSGTDFNDDDWYASSEIELIIADGSWDDQTNKPIMLEVDEDDDGNRIAVIRKPDENNHVASSLLDYFNSDTQSATCGNGESGNPSSCDIQVNNVAGRSNISWGVWITEPEEDGEKILFDEIHDDGTTESDTEDQILAFWIAAERADINQLTGSASFSASNLDCTDASQCMGFADDGLVKNLSANFNVNFNTGDITNGNLNFETSVDLESEVSSTWDVNFSGTMTNDAEFSTNSLSGTVNEADETIIGNIGGIFVKPGDKFAGAYNLGTTETHKHAAGVFTMDKK